MAINQWAYVFSYDMFSAPADGAFTIPTNCPVEIPKVTLGTPSLYWNYDTAYRGYPTFTYGWDYQDEAAAKAFRQAWENSFFPLSYGAGTPNGRLWFTRFNPETNTWDMTSGVVVDVTQADYRGVLNVGSTVTFGRINMHKNTHPTGGAVKDAFGQIEAGNTFEWGNTQFQSNAWPGM